MSSQIIFSSECLFTTKFMRLISLTRKIIYLKSTILCLTGPCSSHIVDRHIIGEAMEEVIRGDISMLAY